MSDILAIEVFGALTRWFLAFCIMDVVDALFQVLWEVA